MSNDHPANTNSESMPNAQFAELMAAVLEKKSSIRFQAKGSSMSPFIRNEDIITISPIREKIHFGDVIAVANTEQRLYVHRVIQIGADGCQSKGDNSPEADQWASRSEILGVVTRVEHQSELMRIGIGLEKYLIALFSRLGWLIPVVSMLRSTRNLIAGKKLQ